jgi:hypothetical protein
LATLAGVARATVLGFGQLEALDHGAHGAIHDDDALLESMAGRAWARV